jgi:hypothetical protein
MLQRSHAQCGYDLEVGAVGAWKREVSGLGVLSDGLQCDGQALLQFPRCQCIPAIAAINKMQMIAVVGLDYAGQERFARFMHAIHQPPVLILGFEIGLQLFGLRISAVHHHA